MMTREDILFTLESVTDPEIPILTIGDLGILQDVNIDPSSGKVRVMITPTYIGCPAMDMISVNIKAALAEVDILDVEVVSLIEPVWTTDWITERGRDRLLAYGIAPPVQRTEDSSFLTGKSPAVPCPQCKSLHTEMISRFGSTACKSLYRCLDCLEPFDYFKCH